MRKLTLNLLALSATLASTLVPLCGYASEPAPADSTANDAPAATSDGTAPNPSNTSNTTTVNETQRGQEQLSEVLVHANRLSLGGGLMSVQDAPKAVSTITRNSILQAAPGANYAQMIESIPGVLAITDDVTGLNDANYSIRGFTNDEVGVTVNGAPINDSGSYRVFPTEYGDTENMSDITVLQGYPDVDQPVAGAAGGTIAWVTIDPSHTPQLDLSLSGGSHDYQRGFIRAQTGDLGPVRSWVSYSHNEVDLWRGAGNANVQKVDAKSVWTIDDNNSVSASLQYNHELKYAYYMLSKTQANANYFQNYDITLLTPTDTNYWRLHTNPFDSYLVSMDGEFRLADTTHLSVVPYFQYGGGGGGGGTTFTESTSTSNYGKYAYTNQDVDNNGTVNGKALVYELSKSYTWRPGAIAKVIQQIGHDDSLEVGFWIDQPRQEQSEPFTPTIQGAPVDIWQNHDSNLIRYSPNGGPQYLYNEYTETSLRRAFLQNTWTPTNQWTVTAGVAYTWELRKGWDYEYYGATAGPSYQQQYGGSGRNIYQKATPTAGIKYQLNDQNQFYVGYGRTFRAPVNGAVLQNAAVLQYYEANPGEVGFSHITAAQLAAVATNQPEIADTVDLGWRYYGDRLSGSIDAYGSNLKNKQVSGFDNATSATVYLAVPELHQRGVNAESSFKIYNDLTLYGSYAYTKSTFAANLDSIGDGYYPVNGKSFLDTPKNTAYLRLSYDHGPFWANLAAKYRSSFWADWMNTESAGGFTTLDFNAGWRFSDFASWLTKPEIKLNVFNLADKHALTYDSVTTLLASKGPLDPNSGKALYASGAFYNLLEPRTFMITIKASLF
ncbi:MAG TPA: TonB-dependent receptor [Steroidobacteraceae bacterium]|nr:TonB-dependent receptor [Steroidobacteraceae bacterium]